MNVVAAAAIGANIGGSNFNDTANALVTTMKNFPNTAGGAKAAMAELNAIVGAGNMHMQDLVDQLGKVVPAGKAFGLTLDDIGGGLDVMTSHGMGAAQSATALKMAITTMGAPSAAAAKQLASIGLSSTQLADDMRKPDGLMVAIQDLRTHLQASGDTATEQAQVLSHAFGGGRTGAGIMLLTQNVSDLHSTMMRLPEGAAALKALTNAQDAYEKTSQGQYDHVKAAVAAAGVSIGASLEPVVVPALKMVGSAVESVSHAFQGMSPTVRDVVIGLGLFAIAAGPVLKIVGNVTKLVGGAVTGIGKLVGAFSSSDTAMSEQEAATAALLAATQELAAANAELAASFDAVAVISEGRCSKRSCWRASQDQRAA